MSDEKRYAIVDIAYVDGDKTRLFIPEERREAALQGMAKRDDVASFKHVGTTTKPASHALTRVDEWREPLVPMTQKGAQMVTDAVQEANASDVRYWARSKGHVVGERGRIPANVVDAYNFENPGKPFKRASQ